MAAEFSIPQQEKYLWEKEKPSPGERAVGWKLSVWFLLPECFCELVPAFFPGCTDW